MLNFLPDDLCRGELHLLWTDWDLREATEIRESLVETFKRDFHFNQFTSNK